MAMSDYSAIGSPFGKLLKSKPKGIILAKTVPMESIPFLQGFQNGSRTLRALEESFVEEIAEDIFETTYTLALTYRRKHYFVLVSDTKDFWLLKDIRMNANTSHSARKSPRITVPIILLVLISAAGYMYQFGLFDKKGTNTVEANPTVYDSYAKQATAIPKPVEQNPEQKTIAQALNTPSSAPSTPAASWEQEKTELQKQIAALTKENESLKKQLSAGKSVAFVIKQGQTTQEIAKAAQDAGIVGNGDEFYHAIVDAKAEQALAPGTYLVVPGTPYTALIEQLTEGAVHVAAKK